MRACPSEGWAIVEILNDVDAERPSVFCESAHSEAQRGIDPRLRSRNRVKFNRECLDRRAMTYSAVVNYFSEFFGAVSNYSRAIRGNFRSRMRRAAFRTPVAEFKTIPRTFHRGAS